MIKNFLQSCDYENGYRKAISDIRNWFENHTETMKHNRLFNHRGVIDILSAMERYPDKMIAYGEDTMFKLTNDGKIIMED